MSTANLLSVLYGNNNQSPTSRSSSLFTKQLSFMSNLMGQNKKSRPSSVSKIIQNSITKSNSTDLLKLTPFIKVVNKLSSKVKKQYFFFWCRMEAYVKQKNKLLKQENKENNRRDSNLAMKKESHGNFLKELKARDNPKTEQSTICNQESKCTQTNQQSIIREQLSEIVTYRNNLRSNQLKINSNFQSKNFSQISFHNTPSSTLIQDNICEQKRLQIKPIDQSQNNKLIEIEKVKQKNKQIMELFSAILSKLQYNQQSTLKKYAFQYILLHKNKLISLQKFSSLQYKIKLKNNKNSAQAFKNMRKLQIYLNKVEYLANSLQDLKKKLIKEGFKLILQKSLFVKNQKKIQNQLKKQRQILKQINLKTAQQIKRKNNQNSGPHHSTNVQNQQTKHQNQLKIQLHDSHIKIPQIQQPPKIKQTLIHLTTSKPLCFWKLKEANKSINHHKNIQTNKKPPFQDSIIPHQTFTNQNPYQRMKKLSHLYVQQPLFQIPDIADITLFNSTIKDNSSLILHLKSYQSQQIQNYTSTIPSQPHKKSLRMITPTKKEIVLSNDKSKFVSSKNKQQITISSQVSPKLKQTNLQHQIKKSTSFSNITLIKNTSTKNNNTPGSIKKNFEPFSKKYSVQLVSDSSKKGVKNYDSSKLNSATKTIFKRLDTLIANSTPKEENKDNQYVKNKSVQLYRNKLSTKKQTQHYQSNHKAHQVNGPKNQIIQQKLYNTSHRPQSNSIQDHKKQLSSQIKHSSSKKSIKQTKNKSQKNLYKDLSYKKSNKENINITELKKSLSRKNIYKNRVNTENRINTELTEFNSHSSIKKKEYGHGHGQNNHSSKQVVIYLSDQFNTLSSRTPLQQFDQNRVNTQKRAATNVQKDEMPNERIEDFEKYDFCSVQLTKDRPDNTKSSSKKLRSKIDKIELNTARKMKLQIQNMINQRKKSSIGLLKY